MFNSLNSKNLIGFILLGLFLGGCQDGKDATLKSEATTADSKSIQKSSLGKGDLTGTVTLDGNPPRSKPIRMDADPQCAKHHGGKPVDSGDILIKEGQLQNAFVYISQGIQPRKDSAPKEMVTIDQKGCLYRPRVVGIQVGQPLAIKNSDALLHNVHAKNDGKSVFNFAMPSAGQVTKKRFKESKVMYEIKCDVHPWMRAYIGVLDHPYFSVTDSSGTFLLSQIPEGTYTISVWHERLGRKDQEITVKANEKTNLEFKFSKNPN